jgi:hypothetical protein
VFYNRHSSALLSLKAIFPARKIGSLLTFGFFSILLFLSLLVIFAPTREVSADSGSLSISSSVILPTQTESVSFSVTAGCYPNCWYFYIVTPTGDCYPILSSLDINLASASGSLSLPGTDWQGGYGCPSGSLPLGTYTAYAGTTQAPAGDVDVSFTQTFTVSDVLPTPVFPLGTIVATLIPILALLAYVMFRSHVSLNLRVRKGKPN